jgi:hypothetical protein
MTTPTTTATADRAASEASAPVTKPRFHREYRVSIEDLEPWAVIPLMQLIRQQARSRTAGLADCHDVTCDIVMKFEAYEHASEPEHRDFFLRTLDEEHGLALGIEVETREIDRSRGT